MVKSVSEGTSEIAGPAGSISEGAFCWTKAGPVEELEVGLGLGACAEAGWTDKTASSAAETAGTIREQIRKNITMKFRAKSGTVFPDDWNEEGLFLVKSRVSPQMRW